MMKTRRIVYRAGLAILVVLWVVGLTCQFVWHKGIESEVDALVAAVSENPNRVSDLRIGGRDILLFHKDLTINCGILGLAMRVGAGASVGIIILLAGTLLVMRKRRDTAQPTPPPYSEPAARSPQR